MKKLICMLLAISCAVTICVGCGTESSSGKIDNSNKKEPKSSKNEVKEELLENGGTYTKDGVSITVDNIDLNYQGGEFDTPDNGKKFVVVYLTIDNQSKEDIIMSGLELYADDSKCENAYVSIEGFESFSLQSIPTGRKFSGAECFQVPVDAKSVEGELTDLDFLDSTKLKIKVQ